MTTRHGGRTDQCAAILVTLLTCNLGAANLLPLKYGYAVGTCFSGFQSPNFPNSTNLANRKDWTAGKMGQVFGIAIDRRGNIFLASTSVFGIYAPGMAGAGGVYRVDGQTGQAGPRLKARLQPYFQDNRWPQKWPLESG